MSSTSDHAYTAFTEENSAEVAAQSFADTNNERLRHVMQSLVRHLHDFAKDVDLTQTEWDRGIEFLTATGQKCDSTRQEFILLSDILGLSMLVDSITNRVPVGATETTVLGPFHMVDSPTRALGDNISEAPGGEPCVITGSVRTVEGEPIPHAVVDVWQADEKGFYDVQQPDTVPERNLRGLFTADEAGAFHFRTIVPAAYPIPTDGPVGALLEESNRHPYRPAHIHFIVGADGFHPITTHIFVAGSPYLESDAVFGVKDSLIEDFVLVDDEEKAARWGVSNPFRRARIDLVLSR
nr:intradiol ring-cleavage dioxygenase [Rhodococcus sp. 06-621-2]